MNRNYSVIRGIIICNDLFQDAYSPNSGGILAINAANHIFMHALSLINCSSGVRGGNAFLSGFISADLEFICSKGFRATDRGQSITFEGFSNITTIKDSSFCQYPLQSGSNSGIRYLDGPMSEQKRNNITQMKLSNSYLIGFASAVPMVFSMMTIAGNKGNDIFGDVFVTLELSRSNLVSNEKLSGVSYVFYNRETVHISFTESILISNDFDNIFYQKDGNTLMERVVVFNCSFNVNEGVTVVSDRPSTHRIVHLEDYGCRIIPTEFTVTDLFSAAR